MDSQNTSIIQKKIKKLTGTDQIDEFYEILELLGEGSFGKVYKAKCLKTDKFWAVKMVAKSKTCVRHEAKLLTIIQHSNIVMLLEVFETTLYRYMVMELCLEGCLTDYFIKKPNFAEVEIHTVMTQFSAAVTYLHNRNIVHRDLKMDNLLFQTDCTGGEHGLSIACVPKDLLPHINTTTHKHVTCSPHNSCPSSPNLGSTDNRFFGLLVKLIDFGLSVKLGIKQSMEAEFVGTPAFMPPEMVNGKSYTRQCDVWSMGIVMFTMVMGDVPFKNMDRLRSDILHFDVSKRLERPREAATYSEPCLEALRKLLKRDPAARCSAAEFSRCGWVTGRPHTRTISAMQLMHAMMHSSTLSKQFTPTSNSHSTSIDQSKTSKKSNKTSNCDKKSIQ